MNFKRVILVSRPIMWTWTLLMYFLGIGEFSNFSILAATEILLFSFPLNFYLYGLNDVYDAKSDRINERKKEGQGIVPDDAEINILKKTVWIFPVLFLAVSLFSRNIEHILLSMAFIALGFAYSYKVVRFKDIPVLDCFTSAAIYSIPALIAYSLRYSIFTLPTEIFFLVIPLAGVHAVTTLVDEKEDRSAGMNTIGVALGKYGTILFSMATFFISIFIFRKNNFLTSVFLVSILLLIFFLFSGEKDDKYFRFALATVLAVFIVLSLVYFILQVDSIG